MAVVTRTTLMTSTLSADATKHCSLHLTGWLDQTEIAHLPSYMSAQFVVAEDMRGATSSEWRDYQGMFGRSVRHLNFSLMAGYPGMYV